MSTLSEHIRSYKLTSEDFSILKDYFMNLDGDDIGEYKGQTISQLLIPDFEEETEAHIVQCLLDNVWI